ncbi:rhodanese-like domain-containing protein [Aliamphritea spongicola]|uniref:rhodanese-like domain-containing protein n=1 Tax=Aliamphritea spongicola TaxID=707589 RepID=UPI00196A4427|nr:rhodanese-like domain-containing protein [Aliamphritea spongicola]MBN3561204.1 rhodanese-like domain-containing protein [Aliamphritea spongicola]
MQRITKGIQVLTASAEKTVQAITVQEAITRLNDEDYIFIDVREAQERSKLGVIPGAFTCPRGMLEFLIDPECPAHNAIFNQDKTYVFYCAHGLRSLFAAEQARKMGLQPVRNLTGGFAEWQQYEGAVIQEETHPA